MNTNGSYPERAVWVVVYPKGPRAGVLPWHRDPKSSAGMTPLKQAMRSQPEWDVLSISVDKWVENQSVDRRFGN